MEGCKDSALPGLPSRPSPSGNLVIPSGWFTALPDVILGLLISARAGARFVQFRYPAACWQTRQWRPEWATRLPTRSAILEQSVQSLHLASMARDDALLVYISRNH